MDLKFKRFKTFLKSIAAIPKQDIVIIMIVLYFGTDYSTKFIFCRHKVNCAIYLLKIILYLLGENGHTL